MRVLGLVFSLTVTLALTALALAYVPAHVGKQRIYVQERWVNSPDHKPYHTYGKLGSTDRDTAPTTTIEPDPYHQRYYSESEGWTYYTLPSYSSTH